MKNYWLICLLSLASCGGGNNGPDEPTGPQVVKPSIGLNEKWEGSESSGPIGEWTNTNSLAGDEMDRTRDIFYGRTQLNTQELKVYDLIWETVQNYSVAGNIGPYQQMAYFQDPLKVSYESFQNILAFFNADCPFFFHTVALIPNIVNDQLTSLSISYRYPRLEYDQKYAAMLKGVDKILSQLPQGLTEYEKVKFLHDEFLTSVSYSMQQGSEGDLYGAFVLKKIVCEGYAHGFQYLLQRAGIQAIYIEGRAFSNGEQIMHAWNMVRIDGKYYLADTTWDDLQTGFSYNYFLKSSATMSDHVPNAKYPLPECNEDY